MRIKQQLIFTTTAQTHDASEGRLLMIKIRTGGIGGTGGIARTTGRQDVCTTILPPGALAGNRGTGGCTATEFCAENPWRELSFHRDQEAIPLFECHVGLYH